MIRAACIALLTAASAHAATLVSTFDDVQYWVGTGPNRAVVIIDWQDGKTLPGDANGQAVAWGYRWENGTTPKGIDALMAIDAADARLQIAYTTFGSTGSSKFFFGGYYDLNDNGGTPTFDPQTESGSATDTADHFREGLRLNGFWGYLNGTTTGTTLPAWAQSGSGASSRTLTDGSWDAWVFSDDLANFTIPDPVLAVAAVPVPEVNVGSLLAIATVVVATCRRQR